MDMNTANDIAQWRTRSARRLLITGSLGALGTLASALPPGNAASGQRQRRGKSRKRSDKNGKCRKPGESCRSHKDCCTGGGMCVEMAQGDGDSPARCCAAA